MTTDTIHDYDHLVDTGFSDDQARDDLHVSDERMQSESRIQRMLNTTLIASGTLPGNHLAVFAR